MSKEKPILSIVTPTRGNFSDYWLEQLLNVKGDRIQFILSYFPGVPITPIDDPRVQILVSPYKGEMMQRFVGLLNATGEYILALDDDDFIHPDILKLTVQYFQKFPDSWVMRPYIAKIDYQNQAELRKPWGEIPDIDALTSPPIDPSKPQDKRLKEVPIIPLNIPVNWGSIFFPYLVSRTDDKGPHIENFNNKVWQNSRVQAILPQIAQSTQFGILTWIPRSAFDRLVGVFLQAYYYQPDIPIGHRLPEGTEQIRFADKDPTLKPPRFHAASDFLLFKTFPQYGYIWNLFFAKLYGIPRAFAKLAKNKIQRKKIRY